MSDIFDELLDGVYDEDNVMVGNYGRRIQNKWSHSIVECGFTAVPNVLLTHRKHLKLVPTEVVVLLTLESFRWDSRNPFPSIPAIAQRSCMSTRTVSRVLFSLEKKKIIKRLKRSYQSNIYDMAPLIDVLDDIATDVLISKSYSASKKTE